MSAHESPRIERTGPVATLCVSRGVDGRLLALCGASLFVLGAGGCFGAPSEPSV